MRRPRLGFTLIELMLTVSIIGLLSAIALPKFSNMVDKAKESKVKGALGSMRSALMLYYADTEGYWPNDGPAPGLALINSLVPVYIRDIPYNLSIPTAPQHANTSRRHYYGGGIDDNSFTSLGRIWFYHQIDGYLTVNCSNLDTGGRVWSSW